jgi:hypothetical protein
LATDDFDCISAAVDADTERLWSKGGGMNAVPPTALSLIQTDFISCIDEFGSLFL